MANHKTTAHAADNAEPISWLHNEAWAAWNASYHAAVPDAYRVLSRSLYQQALHERIETLLARLDQQNAELDARLLPGESGGR